MEFQIPDTAKEVAEATGKIYRRHLDKIAAISGLNTVEKIVQKPDVVVDTISLLIGAIEDDTKKRALARMYYSALFYAMFGHPYLSQTSNLLRTTFHTFDPRLTSDGTPWQQLAAFKKNQAK